MSRRTIGTAWMFLNIPLAAMLLAVVDVHWANAEEKILAVHVSAQEMSNWCWAASAEMTMAFGGRNGRTNVSQCVHASMKRADGVNCCPDDVRCDKSGWPVFERFGFRACQTSNKPVSWEDLQHEINSNRPICGTIMWTDKLRGRPVGHMFLIRGYEIDKDGEKWIHVIDPSPMPDPQASSAELRRGGDEFRMKYEDFRGCGSPDKVKEGWGAFTHWNDYYGVQPK